MEVLTLQATDAAGVVSDDLAPSTGPGTADPRDAARFSELLGGADGTAPVAETQAIEGATKASRTMGDNILSGLHNVSTDLQKTWSALSDSLNGKMTASKMLQVQMGLAHVTLQYELVSKIVARSTQNIDQLVKLQ